MTKPKKPRGNRRSDVQVERDRSMLVEKVEVEGKSAIEAGRELGLKPRAAQRLVSEGLRELIDTNRMEFAELAKLINTAWVEALEEVDRKIRLQKERDGFPSDRILMTKIALLSNLSRALGLGEIKMPDPGRIVHVTIVTDPAQATGDHKEARRLGSGE